MFRLAIREQTKACCSGWNVPKVKHETKSISSSFDLFRALAIWTSIQSLSFSFPAQPTNNSTCNADDSLRCRSLSQTRRSAGSSGRHACSALSKSLGQCPSLPVLCRSIKKFQHRQVVGLCGETFCVAFLKACFEHTSVQVLENCVQLSRASDAPPASFSPIFCFPKIYRFWPTLQNFPELGRPFDLARFFLSLLFSSLLVSVTELSFWSCPNSHLERTMEIQITKANWMALLALFRRWQHEQRE